MEKTILLGLNDKLKPGASQALYFALGGIFLLNGIFQILAEEMKVIRVVLGILMLCAGVVHVFIGFRAFSEKYKIAPRVSLKPDFLEFKPTLFAATQKIAWEDIRSIELGTYSISLELRESRRQLTYQTNASISKEIKQAVREFASVRKIEVLPG